MPWFQGAHPRHGTAGNTTAEGQQPARGERASGPDWNFEPTEDGHDRAFGPSSTNHGPEPEHLTLGGWRRAALPGELQVSGLVCQFGLMGAKEGFLVRVQSSASRPGRLDVEKAGLGCDGVIRGWMVRVVPECWIDIVRSLSQSLLAASSGRY